MNILLCNSTIEKMFMLIKSKINGTLQRCDVVNLLNENDYQFEFERYCGRITTDEFADYFMTFEKLEPQEIINEDLKNHHLYWVDIYNNLENYINKTNNFFDEFNINTVKQSYEIATKGFPKGYNLDEFKLVFTLGIGQSYGYPHKNTCF